MLTEQPRNINQLSKSLNLDYKAIQHHMSVLEKNNLVTKMGVKYGREIWVTYFISSYLEANMDMYNEVKSKILK
jgi:predicted transcriptional regulator